MSDARTHPRLTREQIRELVVAAESGDAPACRTLVESFLPAIASLARGYPTGAGVDRRELMQEGVAGLLFAVRRYDTGLDTPFWAYASFWVRKAMQELVEELALPVVLSDRASRGLAQVRAARRAHLRTHGTEASAAELSEATGLTAVQVESLLATERTRRSLDEPLTAGGENAATVGETIADPLAEREYELVLDQIEISEARDLAERLEERERAVIQAHYGLGQPMQTLGQIGAALGVTAERARQIEAGALGKLRDALAYPALPGAGST